MFGTNTGGTGRMDDNTSGEKRSLLCGEVIDVILNEDHPQYISGRGSMDLGAVKLCPLNYKKSSVDSSFWVNPLSKNESKIPLLGELVVCVLAPNLQTQTSTKNTAYFWLGIVSTWGDVNANLMPNVSFTQDAFANDSPGETFTEKDVAPLQPIEGDVILQGRWSQALRFSSTALMSKPKNTWSIGSTDGDPITILSNGLEDTGETHIEDINNNDSTIMLTSTQKIDLAPANPVSPQIVPVPTGPAIPQLPINTYMGKSQVIINSDRLIFNAKKDNIIISAKKDVSISTSKWKLNMTALADILYATLQQLTMEIHATPCGPTSPPLNTPIYTMLMAQMDQMKN